jgi:hypothetical protein
MAEAATLATRAVVCENVRRMAHGLDSATLAPSAALSGSGYAYAYRYAWRFS